MNHLSHAIRRFNRFELKYLVTLQQAERLKSALGAYLIPDEHSDHNGRYTLASLYYDGPDYRFYWEKVDGIRHRRKLRLSDCTNRSGRSPRTRPCSWRSSNVWIVRRKSGACCCPSAMHCACATSANFTA